MGKQYSSASIKIDGLANLQREMKRLSPEILRAFGKDMQKVADIVVNDVRQQMGESYKQTQQAEASRAASMERRPSYAQPTGRAQSSVRRSFSGGTLTVRAGGPTAPYYPWLDFGGELKKTDRKTFADGAVDKKGRPKKNSRGRQLVPAPRPFIKEGRWIYPTIARLRPDIYRRAVAAVERAKKAAHFS